MVKTVVKLKWTQEENDILLKYYTVERSKIAARLPNRSLSGIYSQARRLGLSGQTPYTPEEQALIREWFSGNGPDYAKCVPNSIRYSAKRNESIVGPRSNRHWAEEELSILLAYFPTEGIEVMKRLPGRSWCSVMNMARKKGLTDMGSWSEKEFSILKEYWQEEEIGVAKRLPGRTVEAIRTMAQNLNLVQPRPRRKWTGDKIAILEEHYGKEPINAWRHLLPEFSTGAIASQASRMRRFTHDPPAEGLHGYRGPRVRRTLNELQNKSITPTDCMKSVGACGGVSPCKPD